MEGLINIIGVVIGAILGGVISFFSNHFLEKQRFNREIALLNKNKIDEAYINIFNSLNLLKEYYEKFIHTGNEFKESKNYKEFAPLNKMTEFFNCVKQNAIYIDDNLNDKIEKLKSKILLHNNIAIAIQNSHEEFNGSEIEKYSLEALEEIENIIKFIKKRFEVKYDNTK